jgi:hypothetical protein
MAGFSNQAENALVDWLWRGQAAPALPANWFFALLIAVPGDDSAGLVEAAGGSYARAVAPRSLAGFAGTQGAGSTAASNGAGATTSNNQPIAWPAPTADWGMVRAIAIFDAAVGGTAWFIGTLAEAKMVRAGDAPPTLAAGSFSFTLDAG